jgi:drug/metabolite transporter (DMT)-like permease
MSDRQLIIAAFAAVYFIWGSTYLINYLAIASIPPFLMSGSRFFFAGSLLFAWGHWRGEAMPTSRQWQNSALMGTLFLTFGTGAVVWALQFIDTGMSALIIAIDPLLIMILLWILFGQQPRWQGVLGAFIGMVGTLVLMGQPALTNTPETRLGLLAIAFALTAWAFASIYVSRIDLPLSRFRRSSLQMITGGVGLLLYSFLSGEASTFRWSQLTLSSGLAWIYLVVLGSIVAFSSFNYLLANVSPEKVATSTYVNPVVALGLGWGFNAEIISEQSLLAAAIMLTGVFFINQGKG